MRLFRTRLRAYVSLVILACLVTAGIVVLLPPPERVTRANFEKIAVGMPLADVHNLLGAPEFKKIELGIVRGPAAYSVDFGPKGLRPDGYQDYTRQQWSSSELTIIVISDATDREVCIAVKDGEG